MEQASEATQYYST